MTTWTMSDGTKVELAKAKCNDCGMILESQRPGHFVECPCGNFVDTDRWCPDRRHRYGGNVTPVADPSSPAAS